ncbi:MAG: serine/threonine-protein phosphatase [Candidatus Wallbacteria bacterium]|nr:serine/threonine-protein phosphatase [Candidatus Wallbacteria bacterium]
MKIFSFTDRGKVRPTNEDALWMNGELGLFLVADGIGSSGRGQEASQGVVRACRDALKGTPRPDDLLPTLMRKANAALYEMAQEKGGSYGATAAILWLRGREARYAWVGDSRVYRLRGEQLDRLTSDHTRAEELVKRGAVPASAASKKSALTRSLGQNPNVEFSQGGPIEVQSADLFLVATDGVTDALSDEDLKGFLTKGPIGGSAAIRQAALERGGPDNLTAVLVEVEPPDLERTLEAAQIASILKEAASRETVKPSKMLPSAVLQSPAPQTGIGPFLKSIVAGGAKKMALEVILVAVFLGVAFLAPELLAMMGRRLESVPPSWFLIGGALLYAAVLKLRAG